MQLKIWIDLDNSPHVPLFIPIINELHKRGHEVIITARDFAQTIELLNNTKLPFTMIGSHYGGNKIKKISGLFIRAYQLKKFIKNQTIHVAMNHGSRSQTLACWWLNIPVFCGLDYEHTESFIFSRFSTKMWVPKDISEEGIKIIGISPKKTFFYNGYKEELYLAEFIPDENFKKNNQIPSDKIVVTLRPSATLANYHDKESENFLQAIIKILRLNQHVFTICLPRTKEQYKDLLPLVSENFFIPTQVLEGLNLSYYSDVLISGGGTMNREAALIGTPVYSIFTGTKGLLDKKMEQKGMIKFIHTIEEIQNIKFIRKENKHLKNIRNNLVVTLVDELLKLAV